MVTSYSTFAFVVNLLAVTLIAAPLYHLANSERARNVILGSAGVVLTFFIAPRLLLFFVIYWSIVHVIVRRAATADEAGEEADSFAIFGTVVLLLIPLLWWRLDDQTFLATLTTRLNDVLRWVAPQIAAVDRSSTILPVGLSFAAFRAVDLFVKTSLGLESRLTRSEMYAYAFFPSVLVVGPIIERKEIATHRSARQKTFSIDDYVVGLSQVLIGLTKVFLFSRPLEQFRDVIDHPDAYAAWELWVGLALFYVSFYLNFAGYSDIAIGFARFFGFDLLPNFRSPLTKPSPQQFWNNWHMSLTRFAQRNVFVPLGGMRAGSRRAATALTMLVIALWHGITFGLVLFAVWHTIGMLYWPDEPADMSRTNRNVRIAATFVFVLLSLPLLLTSTSGAFQTYRSMIGLG